MAISLWSVSSCLGGCKKAEKDNNHFSLLFAVVFCMQNACAHIRETLKSKRALFPGKKGEKRDRAADNKDGKRKEYV